MARYINDQLARIILDFKSSSVLSQEKEQYINQGERLKNFLKEEEIHQCYPHLLKRACACLEQYREDLPKLEAQIQAKLGEKEIEEILKATREVIQRLETGKIVEKIQKIVKKAVGGIYHAETQIREDLNKLLPPSFTFKLSAASKSPSDTELCLKSDDYKKDYQQISNIFINLFDELPELATRYEGIFWDILDRYFTKVNVAFVPKNVLYGSSGICIISPIGIYIDANEEQIEIEFEPKSNKSNKSNIVYGAFKQAARVARIVAYNFLKENGIELKYKNFRLKIKFFYEETTYEGKSAGLAIALAILAQITGLRLKPGVVVSGELNDDGSIEPVGEIKAKLIEADRREDIEKAIIPRMSFKTDYRIKTIELKQVKTFNQAVKEYFGSEWDDFLEEKRRAFWKTLRFRARKVTENLLNSLKQEVYLPEVYSSRKIEKEFDNFLSGDKNGFLLIGKSGVGKTNLMCHLIKEWDKEGHIILFYDGRTIIDHRDIEERIAKDLGSNLNLEDLFIRIDKIKKKISDQRYFLLVFDAVNEYSEDPAALLRSLNNLIERYSSYRWFKVIITCRQKLYQKIYLSIAFNPSNYYWAEKKNSGRTNYEVLMEVMDNDELHRAYAKYKKFFHLRGNLPQELREYLRNPLMLKLTAISCKSGEISSTGLLTQVFEEYLKEKERKDKIDRSFLVRLVHKMREKRSLAISFSKLALEFEGDIDIPLFSLIDSGILREDKEKISFRLEKIFEFLLFKELSAEEIDKRKFCALAEESKQFFSLLGALEFVLLSKIENKDDRFIFNLLLEDNYILQIVTKTISLLGDNKLEKLYGEFISWAKKEERELEIYEKIHKIIALLMVVYKRKNIFKLLEDCNLLIIKKYEENGDLYASANTYFRLAGIIRNVGDKSLNSKYLEFRQKAARKYYAVAEKKEKLGKKMSAAEVYEEAGRSYKWGGEYLKAAETYEKVIKLWQKEKKMRFFIPEIYRDVANCYEMAAKKRKVKHLLDKSRDYLDKAIILKERQEYPWQAKVLCEKALELTRREEKKRRIENKIEQIKRKIKKINVKPWKTAAIIAWIEDLYIADDVANFLVKRKIKPKFLFPESIKRLEEINEDLIFIFGGPRTPGATGQIITNYFSHEEIFASLIINKIPFRRWVKKEMKGKVIYWISGNRKIDTGLIGQDFIAQNEEEEF